MDLTKLEQAKKTVDYGDIDDTAIVESIRRRYKPDADPRQFAQFMGHKDPMSFKSNADYLGEDKRGFVEKTVSKVKYNVKAFNQETLDIAENNVIPKLQKKYSIEEKNFAGAMKDFQVWDVVPFVSGLNNAMNNAVMTNVAQRYMDGNAKSGDEDLLKSYARYNNLESKGFISPYDIAKGVQALPSFIGEIYGLYGLSNTVGKAILGKIGMGSLMGFAGVSARALPATIVQTALNPFRFSENLTRRLMPDIQMDDAEELFFSEPEDLEVAMAKSFGESWVEVASERTGYAFSKVLAPLNNKGKSLIMKLGIATAFEKVNGKGFSFMAKVAKTTGFHGLIEESLEERVGEGARYVLGIDEEYQKPTWKQVANELAVFSVPATGFGLMNRTMNKVNGKPTNIIDIEDNSITVTEKDGENIDLMRQAGLSEETIKEVFKNEKPENRDVLADKIKEVKETEKQSAIVEEAKLFHGTKKGNKAKILKDGFTLNSVKRNYTYSELGETAMYFTKDSNSGWLSPEAAEKMRAVPYDEVVEVSAEGLNLKEIKTPEDWAAFEKELGIEEGGMKDLDVDEADHETLKKKSSDIIQKIKDSGYDGVDLQYTDMEARGHEVPAGEQVAVYNLDKLNVNLSKQKAKPLTGIETTEGDKVSGLAKEALKYDSAEEFKQSLYDREYDYFNKETNDIDYKLYYKTILAKNFIEDFYPNFKDNPILAQEVSDELGIVYSKELSSWVKSPNLSEFFKDKQYGNIDILEKVSIEKIYNEAHAQTKSVAKDTGGDKVSGLAKRMAKNLKEKYGIDISEDDMIKYQSITNEEQIDKAMKIYNDDPARANRIALGLEKPPEGILPTTFYVIAEKMAIKNKDVDMLQMLATQSSIASDASKMGQTIQMLSQIEENSPLKSIQRVVKARKANFEKSSKKSLKEAIKTEKVKLTNEIDEAYDSLDAGIDSFIKELEC
jgi:hypothetical protein